MAEITLADTHALLEKFIEYVMNEVPTKKDMDSRFEQVDKRFEQVDKRFDQVDKRFEQVDKRFEQVDKRFEQVDKRFEQVDKKFEYMDKRFEQMENKLAILDEKKADKKDVQTIITILDKQAKQLDDIRTEQAATNSALLRHEERITALEQK